MIFGTNGLLGAADGAFLLHKDKRTSCEVVLNVSGRDQPDQTFYLNRNEDFLVWELDKTETERRTEKPDQIVKEAGYKNVAAFTKAFEWACEAIKEGQGAAVCERRGEGCYHAVRRSWMRLWQGFVHRPWKRAALRQTTRILTK